ncbi:MAG: hypothetical protein DRP85_00990 [Candidatus Makaraimicrobium thalassicum]|nr:MAG: hypothetical protein DRP85_00990 [Candidatus Omnitrophota bacterium]
MISVGRIAQVTGGRLLSKEPDTSAGGFSMDSRTIRPGQFFIAVKGENFNGHDFVDEAVKKGASGLIIEHPWKTALGKKADHVIVVEDIRKAMGLIAAEIRRGTDIPVVCITGTNGKTTVKDILSYMLSSKYRVLKSRKSYNNLIGLSLTLFDLDPSYDVAVLELGTNHPGEISELAEIAGPHMAIITNIGDAHLEAFVDREAVFAEKMTLLDFLPDTGVALLNGDDRLLAKAAERGVMKKLYGMSPGSDFLITGLCKGEEGYDFFLNGDRFHLPLEGRHNVYNAVAAVVAAGHLGMRSGRIQEALDGVSLPEMRLQRTRINGLLFLNDSYNANPDSFECALEVLQDSAAGRKKGVVAGDMLELGARSDEFHRMVGKSIAGKGIDFLVALGGRARDIVRGALASGMKKDSALCAESHEDAAEMIRRMAGPEAVVLLKGSRKAKMEEVLKCFTISCTL